MWSSLTVLPDVCDVRFLCDVRRSLCSCEASAIHPLLAPLMISCENLSNDGHPGNSLLSSLSVPSSDLPRLVLALACKNSFSVSRRSSAATRFTLARPSARPRGWGNSTALHEEKSLRNSLRSWGWKRIVVAPFSGMKFAIRSFFEDFQRPSRKARDMR